MGAVPKRRLSSFMVEPRYCKGCEICVALCPKKILRMENKRPAISDLQECTVCRICEIHCPDLAIELEESAGE